MDDSPIQELNMQIIKVMSVIVVITHVMREIQEMTLAEPPSVNHQKMRVIPIPMVMAYMTTKITVFL